MLLSEVRLENRLTPKAVSGIADRANYLQPSEIEIAHVTWEPDRLDGRTAGRHTFLSSFPTTSNRKPCTKSHWRF